MDALVQAARSGPVQALISDFYYLPEVSGIALGIHPKFVSLMRSATQHHLPVNEVLSSGKIPPGWEEYCKESGFGKPISPIHVEIWVTVPKAHAANRFKPPVTVGPYAVFLRRVEPFIASADRSRRRPQIMGGISLGHASRADSGTLGSFCRDDKSGSVLILTCAHVLNAAGVTKDVVQQAVDDGGKAPKDTIGTVSYLVPLQAPLGWSANHPFNSVDAALAGVNNAATPSPAIRHLGRPKHKLPRSQVAIGDDIVFVGKESDYQEARVRTFIARAKIRVDGTDYSFGELFEIEPRIYTYWGSLSKGGDSGAWVVRESQGKKEELCGLLYAGNGKTALCGFSETIIADLENRFRLSLSLL